MPLVPTTAVSNTGFSNKVFSKTIVGENAMVRLGEALGRSLFSCDSLGEVTTEKAIEATIISILKEGNWQYP